MFDPPSLFAVGMDRSTDEVRHRAPWTILFHKTEYVLVN